MRAELDLKDRLLHLQTYRQTFTGAQAAAWLASPGGGGAGGAEAAAELGAALVRAGYVKNVSSPFQRGGGGGGCAGGSGAGGGAGRALFAGHEGEVLKFVTANLTPRDGDARGSGSLKK